VRSLRREQEIGIGGDFNPCQSHARKRNAVSIPERLTPGSNPSPGVFERVTDAQSHLRVSPASEKTQRTGF
jgi:hypothetical protein